MGRRQTGLCCVLFAVVLLFAATSHGADVIDYAYTLSSGWLVLDDDGHLWRGYYEGICGSGFAWGGSYPGACAMDYRDCPSGPDACGVIVFPNGDLQPIFFDGQPYGDLILGPPGASNVEDVRVGDTCDKYTIRSGCVFWDWDGTSWTGPCEPLPGTASQTAPETWSEIKAEFKD